MDRSKPDVTARWFETQDHGGWTPSVRLREDEKNPHLTNRTASDAREAGRCFMLVGMKALFSPERTGSSRVSFNVVMVCEDIETGKKARQVYDYIADQIGPGCEFSYELLPLGGMSGSKRFGSGASADTTAADMVILSLHGDRPPTGALESWIESWACHKRGRPHALVALFDREATGRRSPRACLRRVARRAHRDFFVEPAALRRSGGAASHANLLWLL
jgi:hypothetical protein